MLMILLSEDYASDLRQQLELVLNLNVVYEILRAGVGKDL